MSKDRFTTKIAGLTFLALPSFAFASSHVYQSALAAGGIEFNQSEAIATQRENLFISPTIIRAAIEFKNNLKTDYAAIVTFPLPMYVPCSHQCGGGEEGACPACAKQTTLNLKQGFSAKIDGKKIVLTQEAKAFANDHDVTSLLKKYSIDLKDGDAAIKTISHLPQSALKELQEAGATTATASTISWKVRDIYSWNQTFPAGKITRIEYEYPPAYGNGDTEHFFDEPEFEKYCLDAPTKKAIQKLPASLKFNVKVSEYKNVIYLLKNTASTFGSIRKFHLTIEKPESTLISTCFQGLHKTGPRRFEAEFNDFTPKDDLQILFAGAAAVSKGTVGNPSGYDPEETLDSAGVPNPKLSELIGIDGRRVVDELLKSNPCWLVANPSGEAEIDQKAKAACDKRPTAEQSQKPL